MDCLLPNRAIATIAIRVARAVISAGKVTPKKKRSQPNIKATAAPNEAPEEIPRI